MAITVVRYADRPELWDDTEALSREVWPEYNRHGNVVGVHWPRLFEVFPAYQFALYDEGAGEVAAEGHCVPCRWDGTPEGLGDGIDAMIVAALDAHASDLRRARSARWRPRSGRATRGAGWPPRSSTRWPVSAAATASST